MQYVRPIFKIQDNGTVGDALGSAVLAHYRGFRLRITAAHVMNDCGGKYAMPSPVRNQKGLTEAVDFRTGDTDIVENDLSVKIFTNEEADNFLHTDFLELENHVDVSKLNENEIDHLIVAFPAVLQDYPNKLPYIEEVFSDARKGMNTLRQFGKERLKDFVAVLYPRGRISQGGEKQLGADLGGCSGGAILTGRKGSKGMAFSGIILQQHQYKRQDIMLIGVGAKIVIEVVKSAISTRVKSCG